MQDISSMAKKHANFTQPYRCISYDRILEKVAFFDQKQQLFRYRLPLIMVLSRVIVITCYPLLSADF